MDTNAVEQGLRRMADEMVVAGEPVAIDRIVERHCEALSAARNLGLRWASIARLVGRTDKAGDHDPSVSAQHLRASYSRALRKATIKPVATSRSTRAPSSSREAGRKVEEAVPVEPRRPTDRAAHADRKSRTPLKPSTNEPGTSSGQPNDPTDLSEAELAAARQRLS